MDPIESIPLHQANNGDLHPPDIPHQQKNLGLQCDICCRVFTRKDSLSRHRKIHFAKSHRSSNPIESSPTAVKIEAKTEEFDIGLLEESREVLKIYKLLQRIKQS